MMEDEQNYIAKAIKSVISELMESYGQSAYP